MKKNSTEIISGQSTQDLEEEKEQTIQSLEEIESVYKSKLEEEKEAIIEKLEEDKKRLKKKIEEIESERKSKLEYYESKKLRIETIIKNLTFSKTKILVSILIYVLIIYFLSVNRELENNEKKIFLIIPILISLINWYSKFLLKILLAKYENQVKFNQIEKEKEELSQEEDFFKRLVEINFKYLDQYYMQTKEQADKSFLLVLSGGGIGLIILGIGIILIYLGKQSPGNIASVAGILIEFITTIFFYLYNKTLLKTGEYHKKLVLSQNISLALKTTEDFSGDEKFKLREKIITEITKDINSHLCK